MRLNIIRYCMFVLALAVLLQQGSAAAFTATAQHTQTRCSGWNTVPSPNVGTSTNFLNGVAALSSRNIWTVGSYGNGNGGLTLVEHWNGTQWNVVASPNVSGSVSDELLGIAAIAANNIWAVGDYSTTSYTNQALIEHWNGTNWSIVSSPNAYGLAAISALSATNIWAVGAQGNQTLTEYWNGKSWRIVPSSGPQGARLQGVAALSQNNVWAVGTGPGMNGIQTLIEHWNGTSWSVVTSSGPGLTVNALNGLVAFNAHNIWAVGDDSNSVGPSATFAPLFEHWNGSSWNVVSAPLQGNSDILNAIAATSPSDIWAVGDYRSSIDPNGPYFTLIEHWNGSSWSVVTSPSPGSLSSDFAAVAHVPAQPSIWAVGFADNGNSQTLTALHC